MRAAATTSRVRRMHFLVRRAGHAGFGAVVGGWVTQDGGPSEGRGGGEPRIGVVDSGSPPPRRSPSDPNSPPIVAFPFLWSGLAPPVGAGPRRWPREPASTGGRKDPLPRSGRASPRIPPAPRDCIRPRQQTPLEDGPSWTDGVSMAGCEGAGIRGKPACVSACRLSRASPPAPRRSDSANRHTRCPSPTE